MLCSALRWKSSTVPYHRYLCLAFYERVGSSSPPLDRINSSNIPLANSCNLSLFLYISLNCIFVDTPRIRWVSLIINFPTDKVTRLSNERSYGVDLRMDGQTILDNSALVILVAYW